MKKQHPVVTELLTEIETYLSRSGMHRTGFGLKAVNDGHFIRRLETGRTPGIKTIDKVRGFMNGRSKAAKPFRAVHK